MMKVLFKGEQAEDPQWSGEPVLMLAEQLRINFHGEGRARFRLQHAGDRHGLPDPLSWCDISALSLYSEGVRVTDGQILPTMVDVIDGPTELTYNRSTASWMRVLPFDEEEETLKACAGYTVTVEQLLAEAAE